MILLLPISAIVGQFSVRLVAKARLPTPVVLATKCCVVTLLVQCCVCPVLDIFWDGTHNNKEAMVDIKLWIRLVLLSLGLLIGEKFCPIALTGSIATGKSTVARMLLSTSTTESNNKEDVYLIDSDSIGHEILLPPRLLEISSADKKQADKNYTVKPSESVYDRICEAFPDDKDNLVDPDSGLIIRRKLGTVIFSDDQKRRTLNSITHPRIIQILVKRICCGVYFKWATICCADVPLLFESGVLRYLFSLIVVVATTPDLQYQRLRQRNTDLSEKDCRDRIKSQYPMERKVAGADIVIWNNGSVSELENCVKKIKVEIKERLHGGLPLGILVWFIGVPALLVGRR